jgi:tetratricopeptide (TPR) repeat protein
MPRNLVVVSTTILSLFFLSSCEDIEKLKNEIKTLKAQVNTLESDKKELQGRVMDLEDQLEQTKSEKQQVEAQSQEEIQKLQGSIEELKVTDKELYKKGFQLYREAKAENSLEKMEESKKIFEEIVLVHPQSEHMGEVKKYGAELEDLIKQEGPIKESMAIIDGAITEYRYNDAFSELKKVKKLISMERHNQIIRRIKEQQKTPYVFQSYKEFIDSAITGLWVGQRYSAFAHLDPKGNYLCEAGKGTKSCPRDINSAEVYAPFKGKKAKAFKKMKGKAGCFTFSMRGGSIKLLDFKDASCQ